MWLGVLRFILVVGCIEVLRVVGCNNNNVHLSCAHQRHERSHDTY